MLDIDIMDYAIIGMDILWILLLHCFGVNVPEESVSTTLREDVVEKCTSAVLLMHTFMQIPCKNTCKLRFHLVSLGKLKIVWLHWDGC